MTQDQRRDLIAFLCGEPWFWTPQELMPLNDLVLAYLARKASEQMRKEGEHGP